MSLLTCFLKTFLIGLEQAAKVVDWGFFSPFINSCTFFINNELATSAYLHQKPVMVCVVEPTLLQLYW